MTKFASLKPAISAVLFFSLFENAVSQPLTSQSRKTDAKRRRALITSSHPSINYRHGDVLRISAQEKQDESRRRICAARHCGIEFRQFLLGGPFWLQDTGQELELSAVNDCLAFRRRFSRRLHRRFAPGGSIAEHLGL
jgi:hypothetical protein